MDKRDKEFVKYQKQWNEENVEIERFKWQTTNKIISLKEKKVLQVLAKHKGKKILEVGCGEGANSVNMKFSKKYYTGSDYSNGRIRFALKHSKGRFVVADATALQFKNESFDVVFCRDVIHHLRERKKLLSEMYRVCRKGGSIILIESNALNFVNFIFSFVHPKEHDMRQITPNYVKKLTSKFKGKLTVDYVEAYNLDRFFFHYKMGIASLAKYKIVRAINNTVNAIFELIIPKQFRGYMIVELKKR